MQAENYNQRNDTEIAPSLSQFPKKDKKGMYRRLAWWSGLAPFVAFLSTVYIWGILNLLTSASNIQTEVLFFTNGILIPFVLAILPFTLPVGLIFAIYFGFKARRTPVNPNFHKPQRSWWRIVSTIVIVILVLILVPILIVWLGQTFSPKSDLDLVPRLPNVSIEDRRDDSRSDAQDSLGELTLSNLRAQAEVFAYNKFEVSYTGFCDTLGPKLPGLSLYECIDSEDGWAIQGKLAGSGLMRCVDSAGSAVVGTFSSFSGYCINGINANNVGNGEEAFESDAGSIIKQSRDFIETFANNSQGIELEAVSINSDYLVGENVYNGAEFTVADRHIVLSITGIASERADLIGVKPGGQVIGFVPQLRTAAAFEVIFPLQGLNTATNIPFEILVLVDTEMF